MSLVTLLSNQGASSSQIVTLNRLESTAQIFAPTVTLGTPATVSLNRLESTAQTYPPTVIQVGGVQTVTLNRLPSTAVVFAPTVREQQEPQTQLGGFVVPSEKKKRQPVKKKLVKKLRPTEKLTPKRVAEAARYDQLEEVQKRLESLASDVEIDILRRAEADLEQAVQALIREQEQRVLQDQEEEARELLALEQRASASIASLLEQAERRAREELLEVEELLDAMDALGY